MFESAGWNRIYRHVIIYMEKRFSSARVRIKTWGITQGCVLCRERDESREHLFFVCSYSFTVWTNIAGKLLGRDITLDWDDTIAHMLNVTRSSIDSALIRISFQTVLYSIWRERNSKIHGGNWLAVEAVTRSIGKAIRSRISPLRYTGNHKLEGMLHINY